MACALPDDFARRGRLPCPCAFPRTPADDADADCGAWLVDDVRAEVSVASAVVALVAGAIAVTAARGVLEAAPTARRKGLRFVFRTRVDAGVHFLSLVGSLAVACGCADWSGWAGRFGTGLAARVVVDAFDLVATCTVTMLVMCVGAHADHVLSQSVPTALGLPARSLCALQSTALLLWGGMLAGMVLEKTQVPDPDTNVRNERWRAAKLAWLALVLLGGVGAVALRTRRRGVWRGSTSSSSSRANSFSATASGGGGSGVDGAVAFARAAFARKIVRYGYVVLVGVGCGLAYAGYFSLQAIDEPYAMADPPSPGSTAWRFNTYLQLAGYALAMHFFTAERRRRQRRLRRRGGRGGAGSSSRTTKRVEVAAARFSSPAVASPMARHVERRVPAAHRLDSSESLRTPASTDGGPSLVVSDMSVGR